MASNSHDGLVRDLGLGKLRDRVVPQIAKPESCKGALDFSNIRLAVFVSAGLSWPL